MIWKRNEEGADVTIYLNRVSDITAAPSDSLYGIWDLESAEVNDKVATEIYDPSGKRYLFLRWDNRFSDRNSPDNISDGVFRTGDHNNILEMFYYHGNKSSRLNFNFRGNFLILESDSSEKEKIKLKFRRIDYFPT